MKDFLQGRTSHAPTRTNSQPASTTSQFPPINSAVTQVIDASSVAPSEAPWQDDAAPELSQCAVEPNVELVHDAEGRVSHVIVTCRCGDQITLQCNY